MSTTLSTINDLLNDRRRDSSANTIDLTTNGFRAINSTLDVWNGLHNWPWQKKETTFDYNPGITWYPLDALAPGFKSALTLKPYKNIGKWREYWLVSELKFDSALTKPNRFAIATLGTVQYLRVKTVDGDRLTVHTGSGYNEDGLWVGSSGASNVTTDSFEGFELPSSVKFSFSGSSGSLTNSTFNAKDLSRFKDRSNLYFDIFISNITNLSSISLSWGSSSGNYYQVTATTNYLGQPFAIGWNRLKFPWLGASVTGTPVDSAIDFLNITINYGSSQTGIFRVQNFFVSENMPLVLTHYSTDMVSTTGGTKTQKFSNSASVTDFPLWSGRWDAVTEPFVNSVLEIIFWMTGEYNDKTLAEAKIIELVKPLKERFPSQVRMPATFIITDTNI